MSYVNRPFHKLILLVSLLFLTGSLYARPAQTEDDLEMSLAQEPAWATAEPYERPPGSERLQAVRDGRYPAQLVASTGDIAPNRYGPQRNDPAEGISRYAYSPFDERNNREYPCPSGGCDFEPDQVLIKLAPETRIANGEQAGLWSDNNSLNQLLQEQGIVKLEAIFPDAQPPRAGEMVADPDGRLLPKPDLTRWYRATFANREAANVYAAVALLADNPAVAYAEPNYLRRPTGMPDTESADGAGAAIQTIPDPDSDPLFNQQWHLDTANVMAAWQWLDDNGYEPGGSRDIIVAVIDTGVDYTHPDLAGNMWINAAEYYGTPGVDDDGNGYIDDIHGVTTVSGQRSGDPQDDHGHGTHVAGIIAAQANNGLGGVGVAYNVQIMAIKAAQYSGVLSSADIAEGIYYAVAHGADVINMSFGGYARSQLEEDALAVAFGQAVLVAAAGNDGKSNDVRCFSGAPMYPAAYNWVLGVMASTHGGARATFSNWDCFARDYREYELKAPGVNILSLLPGQQYAAWSGTSMAAPVVSGIAVLARTRWPDKASYSSRFIMGQIASNTTGGVVDAYAALTEAPQPELTYLQHWVFDTDDINPINDNDGIVDAGETIDLAIVIRNHWGKAEPVTVTLEAWAEGAYQPDPFVTIITDTVQYGAVGSFGWQDNRLLYDSEGAIIGVEHPFRFATHPDTPNDHVIPFRLIITARNGYDPDDPTVYTSESRFYLLVQRGIELPRIISEDMILTNQFYWLVSDATLIMEGVTVTVTEGAQLQFWSANPDDPYSDDLTPYLQVEGNLWILGSEDNPVELFPGLLYLGYPIHIYRVNSGNVELQYARVLNPRIGHTQLTGADAYPLNSIDHSYFSQELANCIYELSGTTYWGPNGCGAHNPVVGAESISNSIFRRLGWYYHSWERALYLNGSRNDPLDPLIGNLYDFTIMRTTPTNVQVSEHNVFLGGYKTFPDPYGSTLHLWTTTLGSPQRSIGYGCVGCDEAVGQANNLFRNNAILNTWWNPNTWQRIMAQQDRHWSYYITDNYWGTTSTTLIDSAIHDFEDDFNLARYVYDPILVVPPEAAYPFVVNVALSTLAEPDTLLVSAEPVTFTVSFNRDMAPAAQPIVSFGPDEPYTDFTIPGDWIDARTWQGAFTMTLMTGDGYQLIRVAGAVAADDAWLVTGNDAGRFRFQIATSGSAAMNLHANGGEGYVDLNWTQTDFELMAGFNLYRATTPGGNYTRLNSALLPPDQRDYRDNNVTPGQPYYYKFTVVQTSMAESDFSNTATATPIDTIPPVIQHNPLTSAAPGLPLTIHADVTDNVAVQSVTLYHRPLGGATYSSRTMVKTTGDRYAATLEGSLVTAPGLEYYIQASDGISIVRHGQPSNPHQVIVDSRPTVTSVSPNSGPAEGGTAVSISGSLFQSGATVYFGNMAASDVVVLSANQITAVTPPHFPAQVDVTVTNPGDQSGMLLQGFTYQSAAAQLSLPDTGGGQLDMVQIPLSAANVQGLAAADLRITFDPAVLSAQSVATGSLTPGWTLAANTNIPGQITLAMISSGGTVSGSGVLAHITFEVIGAPGATSPLQFDYVTLNDGAIPTELSDGSFSVDDVYAVSGAIRFWQGNGGVPGALLRLVGDRVYTGLSQADGSYTVSGAQADDYLLTPGKADDVNGISAYDASLALQHAAGLITLSGHAFTAADVNRNGAVSSMDAFYILQKTVGLINVPFPGAGAVWLFSPANRSYSNLSANLTGQDFTAILLGDPSGNWAPLAPDNQPENALYAPEVLTATVALPQVDVLPGAQFTAPLTLTLPEGSLYSVELFLSFDPAVITITQTALGDLAAGWMIASNLLEPGLLQVALAGATPIVSNGELLVFTFEAVGDSGDESDLALTAVALNEGGIPTDKEDGHVRIAYPAQADFSAAPLSGPAPLTVVFTNSSTGDFNLSLWDFGDGQTSAATHPTHTYTAPGVYTVTLTVSGVGGQSSLTRPNYINVATLSLSGNVVYWQASRPVGGATLTLSGDAVYSGSSNAAGAYQLTGILAGAYALTAAKNNDVNGITAYDASLALRHAAGLITLEGHAAVAADVNRSGAISSLDASYILQQVVGLIELPFPGADRVWDFDPPERSYAHLDSDLTNQNFTAILLGDPSGNWSPAGPASTVATTGTPTTLSLPTMDILPGGQATAALLTSAPAEPVYAVDLLITYDPAVVAATAVTLSPELSDWMLAENRSVPGQIRLALAGSTPLAGGELTLISFQAVGAAGTETPLVFVQADLNDGVMPTLLEDGRLRISEPDGDFQLYLPIIVNAAVGQTANAPSTRAISIFEMVRQSRPGYYRWSEMAR